MAAAQPRDLAYVFATLALGMIVGALIGGFCMGIALMGANIDVPLFEWLWRLIGGTIGIAWVSLIVVAPCTTAFGLPSVALIYRLRLGRWAALGVCVATATVVQAAALWLLSSPDSIDPKFAALSTPFALGAALTVWWRLVRP